MFSSRTMQPADWAGLKVLKPGQFRAPEKMGLEFIQWHDEVLASTQMPFTITSSYRSPDHNAAIGGAKASAHMDVPCNAADIVMGLGGKGRLRLVIKALAAGCRRIGLYANGSVHLDRTEDERPADVLWTTI